MFIFDILDSNKTERERERESAEPSTADEKT